MRMSEFDLVIFSGLQAAGKSTFYARRFATAHVLVSKDRLRRHRRPGRRQAELIAEALAARRSVVVDNTNPTPEVRAELIALGRQHGARIVGYWFPPDVRASVERNAQREGRARVPPVAIYATATRLVAPSHAEDFDALSAVRIAEGGDFAVEDMPEVGAGK
jgi:predicted kinase